MSLLGRISHYVSGDSMRRIIVSTLIVLVLWLLQRVLCSLTRRRVHDLARFHSVRRVILYSLSALGFILVGRVWIKGIDSLATILGLASAGIAIAMHDTIANLAAWLFIISLKPFKVGDRIEIGGVTGDVIDIRLFQFSLNEIGGWVDADQSTGRIVHVPNGKVLREQLANFETGFEYIWHEIPVLLTFESDWEKAKRILGSIAHDKVERLSEGAAEQIRRAAMKYFIFYNRLTPTVYTTVKESGVLLSIRYIVKPRQRRGSEQDIWEAVLREFAKHDDVRLAYPTTRFFQGGQRGE